MNWRPPSRFLGRLVVLVAIAEIAPLVCSLFYLEGQVAASFAISLAITAASGGLMMWFGRGDGDLYRREGILIVVGGWVLASIFGGLPYLLTGTLHHPVDALFEAASGFTTTGATVLTSIESVSRGVLFWRSFTQWLGGMGIIVLFVALLPELGPGARFLYKLEVPGPTAEALSPRIRDTASVVWRLYLGFTAAETLLLMLSGLSLYDALTHTFATLSTGGFSPYSDSIAAFDSPLVQVIVIVFMLVAGTNFSLFYGLKRKVGWHLLSHDTEFRIYLALIAGSTIITTAYLTVYHASPSFPRAVLDSLFQVVSIQTTTGFVSADFELWPVFPQVLLVALMFAGGCAGSTSGSMKVMRMAIGLRTALREARLIFSPSAVLRVTVGRKAVPEAVVRSVSGFFILFLSTWGLGSVLLTASGHDPVTAATAAIATLGNIGPGLAMVGPTDNFAFFGSFEKLLMVLLMWLGRLEIYAIAAMFTARFWRR